MRPLAALERIIERLVERSSARLFRTRIQPLHIQRRVEREMETHRRSVGGRTMVPNRFSVRLNPADLAELEPVAQSVVAELADAALTFARTHRYAVADRPRVSLVANRAVAVGDIDVDARFEDPWRVAREGTAARDRTAARDGTVDQLDLPGDAGSGESPADRGVQDLDRTMVFAIPQPEAPLAVLRELLPDGSDRQIVLDGRPLTIGRATDNDLVLNDSRVSRHHARLQGRRGTLVLTDLGSSNGTRVNGITVQEVVLGPGDRIQLGDSILVVDSVSNA
jgi:Protein of unknown function (DUF3662)/FHA domain